MQLNDWLTASLSVLTIALTILGVVIAVVAVFGYSGLKDHATTAAEKAAKAQVATFLDQQAIQDKLKEEIKKRVAQEADALFSDLSLAQAYGEGPAQAPGRVGEEYPGDGNP